MVNRLGKASSPYLLQHADNPVDWHEWTPEAFDEARRRDLPILLSVGYAACHWCHVMAHESFEDADTADLMNRHFVNVKVDREERPDVDAVYMEAVQALTGHGGWPMTAFLTPDGHPFYAGTYYPPRPHHGLPSFTQVLLAVARTWDERRGEVLATASDITARLDEQVGAPAPSTQPPTAADLDAAVHELARSYDARRGGFGSAPKFPPSLVLEFLLRHHARTGSEQALQMAEHTFEAMARGGLYDQLGGGFARYSVDADWVVPHFEKMLYDNALLLRAYAHWWRLTGSPLAERVVAETAEFLLRDLRTPQGGFASSLDADADGVEGLTYAWSPAELAQALGPDDGPWAARLLGVTAAGTFEHGRSVLQRPFDPPAGEDARWARVRAALLDVRGRRPQPARDDKVVCAWNGWAVAALAEAAVLLDRPPWLDAARTAAHLLLDVHLGEEGRLVRVSRDGVGGRHAGVLEDYAALAEGLLVLFSVTGDAGWLPPVERLLDVVLVRFAAPDGGFFDTADDAESLVRRPRDRSDNVTPSGTTAAAGVLLSWAALTGSDRHRAAAERALGATAALAPAAPRFVGHGLSVAEALVDGPREVAVVGDPADPAAIALRRVALLGTAPGLVVAVGDGVHDGGVPLLSQRPTVGGQPAAYVCRGFVCTAPTTDPGALAAALGARTGATRR